MNSRARAVLGVAAGLVALAGPALAQQPKSAAPTQAAASASFDEQFKAAGQLAHSGKREEALAAYTALLAKSPNNSDVLLARGRLYGWMDRWPESEADLLAATKASPRYADAWSGLGEMYRWTDRPAQAAEAYKQWSLVAPLDPAPHLARGRALRLDGDRDGARAEFEMARTLGAEESEVDKALDTLRVTSLEPGAIAAAGYHWQASVNGAYNWVSDNAGDYETYGATLRRYFERGSLAAEVLGIDRFAKTDTAYALDGYADLWSRAYTNVRFQLGPEHKLFPKNSGRVELYQGVGKGWELAASEDWLNFSSTVNIYGVAVAKYLGNYYGRLRMTYVDPSGNLGWRLTMRDYYRGDAEHYLEAFIGAGHGENTFLGVKSLQWSETVGVAWVTFFNPSWGMKVGADYTLSNPIEKSVSATVYTRW